MTAVCVLVNGESSDGMTMSAVSLHVPPALSARCSSVQFDADAAVSDAETAAADEKQVSTVNTAAEQKAGILIFITPFDFVRRLPRPVITV